MDLCFLWHFLLYFSGLYLLKPLLKQVKYFNKRPNGPVGCISHLVFAIYMYIPLSNYGHYVPCKILKLSGQWFMRRIFLKVFAI